MSAYYRRKGWGMAQFSVLRYLSEILIQKTLVERYPDLQAHQVSCHAAHQKNERIYPCGNCAKCRRIVAILSAFDQDPHHCGYSTIQVQNCLQTIAQKGIDVEPAAAPFLNQVLHEKGLISRPFETH